MMQFISRIIKGVLFQKICFAILLAFQVSMVESQVVDFTVRDYQEIDGLTHNGVNCILQDSKGFLWFGTRNGGLDRFDGYSFEHHKTNPYIEGTISSNTIATLFEDKDGFIWAGVTGKGISKYNPKTKTFKNYIHDINDSTTLAGETVKCFEVAQDGKKWIGCWPGLCVYNEEKDNFERIEEFSRYRVVNVAPIEEDKVLIGTQKNGIYLMDLLSKEIIKKWEIPVNRAQVNTVFYDSNGMIWCGTWKNGIYRLDNVESDDFIHINDQAKNITLSHATYVRDFHEDENGNLWVASAFGIFIIPASEMTKESPASQRFLENEFDRFSLSNSSLLTITEDRDGDFWSGTWRDGVNHINVKYRNFKHFQYAKDSDVSLNSPVVHHVLKHKEKLYIAVRDGGLNVYDLKTGRYKFITGSRAEDGTVISPSWIYSLEKLSEDILAMGSNDGLFFFDVNTEIYTQYFPGVVFENIKLDSKGILWLASWRGGLWALDISSNKTGNYEDADFIKVANGGRALLEDNKGRMWVSNNNHLAVYNDPLTLWKRFEMEENDPNSISHLPIRSFALNKDNNVLLATDKGLNVFNEDSLNFTVLAEWDGLPANSIENIIADTLGKIWITTNKGLSSFTLDLSADQKTEMVKDLQTYTIDDGLQANSFIYNSCSIDEDGVIYLGGTNGFNSFDPSKMVINTIPPQAVVSEFRLFNKPVLIGAQESPLEVDILYTDKITLTHKQSVFTFTFTALNYNAPEKNEYAYILEGFDEEWNYIGKRREANFSNLPAGKYVFRVKASNNDGVWGEASAPINIRVKPPWYKTKLFLIILIGSIVYGLYWFFNQRKQKAEREKKMLEDKIREGEEIVEKQQAEVNAQQEEIERRNIEEHEIRFTNRGIAKFSEILSKENTNLKQLSQELISEIVPYVDAEVGVFYILQEGDSENDNQVLELFGSYAYDMDSSKTKRVEIGENYLGTCFKESKTLIVKDLTEDYISLSSGLGKVKLTNLCLVPIKHGTNVQGIIEIASIESLEEYKVKLIEKIAENITSVIAIRKAGEKMNKLLEESHIQAEELRAQEEEMRQNMEEMNATQEEMQRQIEEQEDLHNELNTSHALLDALMNNLPDYVFFKDKDSKFIRISKSMLPLFPFDTLEAMIGKSDYDFHSKENADLFYKEEQEILEKGQGFVDKESHEITKNNVEQWVAVTKLPLYDRNGDYIGIFGISKNITEYKKFKKENEELKQKLKHMK